MQCDGFSLEAPDEAVVAMIVGNGKCSSAGAEVVTFQLEVESASSEAEFACGA